MGAVEAERHVNWFALEKAAERPGCPVCTIVVDRSRRYIDNMLFEHVSDRGFRAAYRASLGFCREHARDLESFRDGLAVAILGSDALCEYLSFLERGKSARARGRCPACAETERVEREFLSFILSTSDPEFVAFFEKSEGLCVPHYARALAIGRPPAWLRDFQLGRFRSLASRTREFIERSAWGRQEDFARLSEADKTVWKELARALRGD